MTSPVQPSDNEGETFPKPPPGLRTAQKGGRTWKEGFAPEGKIVHNLFAVPGATSRQEAQGARKRGQIQPRKNLSNSEAQPEQLRMRQLQPKLGQSSENLEEGLMILQELSPPKKLDLQTIPSDIKLDEAKKIMNKVLEGKLLIKYIDVENFDNEPNSYYILIKKRDGSIYGDIIPGSMVNPQQLYKYFYFNESFPKAYIDAETLKTLRSKPQ